MHVQSGVLIFEAMCVLFCACTMATTAASTVGTKQKSCIDH